MVRSTIVSLIVALSLCSALQFKAMERAIVDIRDDFIKAGKSHAESHEVVFAVNQQNLGAAEELLFQVSDPRNAKYGQYLSREAVGNMTSNPAATSKITNFLKKNGAEVVGTSPFGEYITATGPITLWEKMFDTKFFVFNHAHDAMKPIHRALQYSIPMELEEHVAAVFNTVQMPARVPEKKELTLKTAASKSITPALLNKYYHITSNKGNSLASQSVFESLEQYYSPNDLFKFEELYGVPKQDIAEDIGGYVSDSKCTEDPNNCLEANLDVQYLIALSQDTPTTYWYDGSSDSFLHWIKDVAAAEKPPLVHSISYGAIEPELPKSFANAFNTEAMKLGLQGVTILVSSGDDGVANFQARTNKNKCGYNPSFPASSPYVTAVGATQGPESGTEEIACTSDAGGKITTGGGFSTIFTAPTWQKETISTYFNGLTAAQQPASGYATSGRGYPDVSLAGFNYDIVAGGKVYQVSGTSASAPAVAAMISLINAERLAAGKSALGFLNPVIYQSGTKFSNDIVKGDNSCTASKICCEQGFVATKGWDPLTGFGSVDYAKLHGIFATI